MTRTLHEELRTETRNEHVELETALDLMRPDFTVNDYVDLLIRYQAFYASFERFLARMVAAAPAREDFLDGVRQRKRWLLDDLRDMDVADEMVQAEVPQERFKAAFPRIAYLFGAMYVIEGSALGGVMIAKHFMKNLGISENAGLRFFYGHGQKTKEKWVSALQLLAECDAGGMPRHEIVDGAKQTFALLRRQLVNEFVV